MPHVRVRLPRTQTVRSWWRRSLGLILLAASLTVGKQPANARQETGIVTIHLAPLPTLLAVDPRTHQVYVRTLGVTNRYGNPGKGAGYTLLDGTTGKVLRVWPDHGGYPPVAFVSTDNGLWAVVPAYPAAVYSPIPTLKTMSAQMGSGVAFSYQGSVVADTQRRWVALITLPHPVSSPPYTLWVFAIRTAHLLGRTTLPQVPQVLSVAFDAAANRVMVAYDASVQLFTLADLHYLATITHRMYAGASTTVGYDNRLYDTEPAAVDTSLGQAVVISGVDGPGEAQIIDLTTRRVLRTLTVGIQPINVQVDTALHRAYILDNGSCEVNILDLPSGRVVANVAVGPGPLGLAVNEPTGKVFVTQGVGKSSHVLMFPAATTLHQPGCD